jgi:ADP-ribose pyrophosphatase YjhB (NUDIX family)
MNFCCGICFRKRQRDKSDEKRCEPGMNIFHEEFVSASGNSFAALAEMGQNMWHGGVRVVIPDAEGRILLVRQAHDGRDIWMVPGGAVMEGESSRDAAIREIMEETGLIVHIGSLLWHVEEVSEARGQRFVNFFLADIIGGKAELGSDPELEDKQVMQELGFFSREEIAALEHVYPDYLRDEIWNELSSPPTRNAYRIR